MNKKYYRVIAVIILIIGIVIINKKSPSDEELYEQAYKAIKFDNYNGMVEKKYFEKDSKNYPTLLINNDFGTQKVMFIYDKSGLYQFVNVGDSIFKEYGKYEVLIKRDDRYKIFTLRFHKD